MAEEKNLVPGKKSELDQKEREQNAADYKPTESIAPDTDNKEGDLKPSTKISGNIHVEPADEQQFENENEGQII